MATVAALAVAMVVVTEGGPVVETEEATAVEDAEIEVAMEVGRVVRLEEAVAEGLEVYWEAAREEAG